MSKTRTANRTNGHWPDFVTMLGRRERRPTVLYVAADLSVEEIHAEHAADRELKQDERVYRKLDAEYYAWLRGGVDRVTRSYHAGEIGYELFIEVLTKFNAVRWWAEKHVGKKVLDDAIRTFDPRDYVGPPVPEYVGECAKGKVGGRRCPIGMPRRQAHLATSMPSGSFQQHPCRVTATATKRSWQELPPTCRLPLAGRV